MTIEIINSDCLAALELMPSESVHCCVTSPPYWGLRDYGVAGQIGLEGSLAEHIDVLVRVFSEVRRVLRKDGTCWINYGDAYASAPNGRSAADTKTAGNDDRTFRDKPISTVGPVRKSFRRDGEACMPAARAATPTLKPKDRMMLPARLAIALQESGWWLRDEIVWHKPNPMPSSVKDRTTPAHEMIYLLTKSPRYYFDQEAILAPCSPNTHARLSQDVQSQVGSARANGGVRADRPMKTVQRKLAAAGSGTKNNDSFDAAMAIMPTMRNPRSVWTVPPKGFKEAHFATFPPDLIEPCILAGCPPGGTVLDPFFGAGTTGLVAERNGRDCIGIELSAAYIDIAKKRLGLPFGVFA